MKKARKALLTLCAALLLVSVTAGMTIAYLTDTDTVTNTFSVGNVDIKIDEADAKTDGTLESTVDVRVNANKYHLLPGHDYIKDPTITVQTGSESCYLYVMVTNGLVAVEAADDATYAKYDKIATQMAAKGWTCIDPTNNIWSAKKSTGEKPEVYVAGEKVVVFDGFTVTGDVSATDLDAYKNSSIVIKAFAIQADGFDSAAEAWTTAKIDITK